MPAWLLACQEHLSPPKAKRGSLAATPGEDAPGLEMHAFHPPPRKNSSVWGALLPWATGRRQKPPSLC